MELIEFKQTSATIQCLSCLKHPPEGLNMCQCGVWLRSNQRTMERIRAAFAALKTPYFRTTPILSRGRKLDIIHGRQIMPKPWMHEEEQRQTAANFPLYWTDGRTTRSTELLNWCTVGLKSTSSISITAPSLKSVMDDLYKQRNRHDVPQKNQGGGKR